MAEPETETPAQPPTRGKGGKGGARARIEVEGDVPPGTVGDVLDAAGRGRGGAPGKTSARADQTRFEKAIKDTRYRIFAKRLTPQTMPNGTPLGDEFELFPTGRMTTAQLKADIRESRGGNKWHVRVLDDEDNVVAADTLVVGGEPILDPMMEGFESAGRGNRRGGDMEPFGGGAPFETENEDPLATDKDVLEAAKRERLLESKARQAEKEAELEEAEARREEAKAKREAIRRAAAGDLGNNGANGKHSDDADPDKKLQALLEAQLRPMREENERLRKRDEDRESRTERMREMETLLAPLKSQQEKTDKVLESLLAKISAPPPPPPSVDMDKLLTKLDSLKTELRGEMKDGIATALTGLRDKYDGQFQNLSNQLTQIAANKNADPATAALVQLATRAPGGGAPADPFALVAKATEAMKSLAETKTMMTGGSTTPPDFPSYLVEKTSEMVPEVLGFMERRAAAGGGLPTREELDQMMRAHGTKMYEGLSSELKTGISKVYEHVNRRLGPGPVGQPGALPAPAQPSAPAAAPSAAPPQAATVQQQPGAIPGPVAFPGAAPGAAAAPPASPAVPSEQIRTEYHARVNYVLKGLLNEMQIGMAAMKWPGKAYEELPRDIVEKIALSETYEQVLDTIKPYADPVLLNTLGDQLRETHPKHAFHRKWVTAGINWIKDAYEAEDEDGTEQPVAEDAPQS